MPPVTIYNIFATLRRARNDKIIVSLIFHHILFTPEYIIPLLEKLWIAASMKTERWIVRFFIAFKLLGLYKDNVAATAQQCNFSRDFSVSRKLTVRGYCIFTVRIYMKMVLDWVRSQMTSRRSHRLR